MRTRFAGWSKNGERQVCNQRIVNLAPLLLFYLLSTSLRQLGRELQFRVVLAFGWQF